MSFFYDLNKKLDGIRATPEVKNQPLNEQASPLAQVLNERATGDYSAVKAAAGKDIGKPGKNFDKIAAGAAKRYGSAEAGKRVAGAVLNKLRHSTKEGMGFLGEKDVEEAYNPNSVDAEHRRSLEASHMANLKKKAAAGDESAKKRLQALKDKKERMRDEYASRMERESAGMDESALQAAFGKKKYGAQGMKALQKAGRDNASDSTMDKIRNRYDKYDESQDMTDEGNEFSGNRDKAIKAGQNKFKVDGRTYPVRETSAPSDIDGATAPPPKGKDGQYPVVTAGPNKGKRWSPATPGPTNPAMKEQTVSSMNAPFQQDRARKADLDQRAQALSKTNRDFRNEYTKLIDERQAASNRAGGTMLAFDRFYSELEKLLPQYEMKETAISGAPQKSGIAATATTSVPGMRATGADLKKAGASAALGEVGGIPKTAKQKSFAKLAPPVDKITFADKIVGAKKEVDEMLGDVAAEAMKSALRGGNTKKVDEVEGKVYRHKGTYGTEYDGDQDDARALAAKKKAAAAAGQATRGRGRPKNNASADTGEVMKPDFSAFGDKVKLKPFTGKVTKHKMVGENDVDPEDQGEYDQEGDMAKEQMHTIMSAAKELHRILRDDENLPEWVQKKITLAKEYIDTARDYMLTQHAERDEEQPIAEKAVSKNQAVAARIARGVQKGEAKAEPGSASAEMAKMKPKELKKFAKTDTKGLPKKKKEVEETTSSGSVATSSAAPKAAKGMSYGKGIYDSLNRQLENMISESMNINMSINNDDNGGPRQSLTVTATDDDAVALASMLRMAGMGSDNDHMPHMDNDVMQPDEIQVLDLDDNTDALAAELSNEFHSDHDSEVCSACGSSDCGCNDETMDEAYGDTNATQNHPDYPTDEEGTDNAMMYSGGLNKPKSTGQTTTPVINGQDDRMGYEGDHELRRMMEIAGLR